jgi:mono/diheme cytochrome c family protein
MVRECFLIAAAVIACIGCESNDSLTVETRPEAASRGKALYDRYGCAVCHGVEGRGDGPVGRSMKPSPRDFRDTKSFKNGRSLGAIAETILNGVKNQGVGMPGYPHIPAEERRAIGAYVASLHASD